MAGMAQAPARRGVPVRRAQYRFVRCPLLRAGAAQCMIRGGGASVDRVKAGMLALLLAADAARPAHACDLQRWQPPIAEAARRYALPENWIRAVMRAESAGCTELDGRPITSPEGAMGLMQLMPETWAELRQRHGLRPEERRVGKECARTCRSRGSPSP